MKPTQNNNLRRSRSHNRRQSNNGSSVSVARGNSATRVYDSNGPDGKLRGTPIQISEKYVALAKDAQASGDIIKAESYLQHAEHYNRIVLDANAHRQAQNNQRSVRRNNDNNNRRNYQYTEEGQKISENDTNVASANEVTPA